MAKKGSGKGRWFAGGAIVILRNSGNVLNNVQILEESFEVETEDLGTLSVPVDRVKTIIYQNLPSYQTDMLRTMTGNEYNGIVLNDPIRIKTDDLGTTTIRKSKVLSIIW